MDRPALTPAPELTAADGMPIVRLTLDYGERLCALIPDELRQWRPPDPSGRYCFSLEELAMHMADARWLFAGQLDGEHYEGHNWAIEQAQDGGAWSFKTADDFQQVLDSLAQSRARLEHWLSRPLSDLYQPTPGTSAFFNTYQQHLREQGKAEAATAYARRGPATLARTLASFIAHESGHRGALQTLLRMHGIDTGGH
jgi:uncharacterized damage-inducible protein DinB